MPLNLILVCVFFKYNKERNYKGKIMFNTIIKASENFCIHQIREACKIDETLTNNKLIITYIDINPTMGGAFRIYLASDKPFMQKISKLFLDEDESDEETLVDMTLETTNLIIGSAKVISEDSEKNMFTIQTPHFMKIDSFDLEYEQIKVIRIEENTMLIAMKELDDNS